MDLPQRRKHDAAMMETDLRSPRGKPVTDGLKRDFSSAVWNLSFWDARTKKE